MAYSLRKEIVPFYTCLPYVFLKIWLSDQNLIIDFATSGVSLSKLLNLSELKSHP